MREMKNDEERPVVGDQWSEAQRDGIGAASLPPFVEILQRVMERSKDADDGALTFTFEEMEFLAKDPLFAHFEPAMAADIRKVLAKGPPGD
ncbi:MAG: hypothetical protein IJI57_14225 [Flexilinea sp.]|nr:hypothetical protein [Flexilinea sp.]